MSGADVLYLRQIESIMQLRKAGGIRIRGLWPKEKGRRVPLAYRSQDVRRYYRRHRSLTVAHLGKGAASPPVASPGAGPSARAPDQTRFAFWTSDRCFDSGFDEESLRALHRPPDRVRRRSPPGPPSTMGLAPWTRAGGVPPLPP